MEFFKKQFENATDSLKDTGKKVAKVGLAAGIAMNSFGAPALADNPKDAEKNPTSEIYHGGFKNPELKSHADQNMPDGITRYFVYAEGIKNPIASVFWLEEGKAKISFKSNDLHPQAFSPEIFYDELNDELEKSGQEIALAFPGAYKSPNGNIEGVAFENGKSVGENNYSKWHGFLYIAPNGSMEMSRLRDQNNNFQKAEADALVSRAKREGGSMFQQIPAIWDGQKRLNSSSQSPYEWRAIAQTKNGEKFVINCQTKCTQDEFLTMCNELTSNGGRLVDDLLLVDTGIYSEAIFRDKNQIANNSGFIAHPMKDENYPNTRGYTNAVVVSVPKR